MSKFVKVAQWSSDDYFENNPKILYLSVDCIEKFYRITTDFTYYNFKPYFIAGQVVLDYHIHPIKIKVSLDGDSDPIHLHWEILDL